MTTTPQHQPGPTLGDLATRLYARYAKTIVTHRPAKYVNVPPTLDFLLPWEQDVWVAVAAEAVKAGAEIRQENERQDDERLVNHPDFQVNVQRAVRDTDRWVLRDCE